MRDFPTGLVPLGDGVVALAEVTLDDVEDLLDAHGDPALTQWVAGWWQEPPTVEAARTCVAAWHDREASIAWAIREQDANRLLGVINLFNADPDGVEVGYWSAPWGRGRGVMTRSLRLVASHARRELDAKEVRLYHAVENTASCAVATRAGFRLVAVSTASWKYPDGRRHDEHQHVLGRPPMAGPGPRSGWCPA